MLAGVCQDAIKLSQNSKHESSPGICWEDVGKELILIYVMKLYFVTNFNHLGATCLALLATNVDEVEC